MSNVVCRHYAIMLSVIYPIVLSAVMFNVDVMRVMAPKVNKEYLKKPCMAPYKKHSSLSCQRVSDLRKNVL